MLLGLLSETTRLYAKLSIALGALQMERDNKLLSAHAAAAAISHEIRQPLTGIAMNGSAALAYLRKVPPDLGKSRDLLEKLIGACHHASEVMDGIRTSFA